MCLLRSNCYAVVDEHTVNGFPVLVKTSSKANWIGYFLTPYLKKNKRALYNIYLQVIAPDNLVPCHLVQSLLEPDQISRLLQQFYDPSLDRMHF